MSFVSRINTTLPLGLIGLRYLSLLLIKRKRSDKQNMIAKCSLLSSNSNESNKQEYKTPTVKQDLNKNKHVLFSKEKQQQTNLNTSSYRCFAKEVINTVNKKVAKPLVSLGPAVIKDDVLLQKQQQKGLLLFSKTESLLHKKQSKNQPRSLFVGLHPSVGRFHPVAPQKNSNGVCVASQKTTTNQKQVFVNIYITSTFHNNIINVTDSKGNTIVTSSGGKCGFKGRKKSSPFAAKKVAETVLTLLQNNKKFIQIFKTRGLLSFSKTQSNTSSYGPYGPYGPKQNNILRGRVAIAFGPTETKQQQQKTTTTYNNKQHPKQLKVLKQAYIFVSGTGFGKDSAIREFLKSDIRIISIFDTTNTKHNGCRLPKKKRK